MPERILFQTRTGWRLERDGKLYQPKSWLRPLIVSKPFQTRMQPVWGASREVYASGRAEIFARLLGYGNYAPADCWYRVPKDVAVLCAKHIDDVDHNWVEPTKERA